MTDFETHPAGTADLVKRLLDWTEYDEGKVNDTRHEAADRIEQLVATVEQLDAALTRANAATAAAYEVAARVITDRKSEMADVSKTLVGTEKIIFAEIVSLLDFVASAIRALATIDQTAALDKLIAEAETRVWAEAERIAKACQQQNYPRAGDSEITKAYRSGLSSAGQAIAAAIEINALAASKKGGV